MSTAGRYHSTVKLGEGTYGAVYRAVERDTGRIIAFKRMVTANEDEGVPGTVIREICILQSLRHENIVSMYEVLFDPPKITLIFEFCNCDLKQFLDRREDGRMNSMTEVRPVFKQMFTGLQYLHSHNVVHRDLKPQNIFLNLRPTNYLSSLLPYNNRSKSTAIAHNDNQHKQGSGNINSFNVPLGSNLSRGFPASTGTLESCLMPALTRGSAKPTASAISVKGYSSADPSNNGEFQLLVKLGDFGLARVENIPVKKYSHEVVTLWYRSPDVLMGSALYSFPVDVWSMGAIFFEMVTGKVLFSGKNEDEQLFYIFFLLGSPTQETWPSMPTFPRMREALQRAQSVAMQLRSNIQNSVADYNNSIRGASQERGHSRDIFSDFLNSHIEASVARVCNFYGHDDELWFPIPMLDAFLIETGFRDAVGDDGVDLLRRCLHYEASRRITCNEALHHPFLSNVQTPSIGKLDQLVSTLEQVLHASGL